MRRGPIAGAMNAKKMRKVMGAGSGGGSSNNLPTAGAKKASEAALVDEKKELLRLKREIREKKALEKRLADLE